MTDNQTPNQAVFTDQEADTIRRGIMAATALVSQAEPGFFDALREAMAGSKALAAAPEDLRRVMQGGFVTPPKASSKEDLHNQLVQQAQDALRIGDAKGPQVGKSVRELMRDVTTKVAAAADGISPKEQQIIDRILAGANTGPDSPGTTEQFATRASDQNRFEQPQFGQPTDPTQL